MEREIDIIAEDARGRDVLLVEVKASTLEDADAWRVVDWIRESGHPSRFIMVVDRRQIRVADLEQPVGGDFACVLPSSEVFAAYDPDYAAKRVFHFYLSGLADAWLRDVAFRWKSENPPGVEALQATGVLDLLQDGDTRREVLVGCDPVR